MLDATDTQADNQTQPTVDTQPVNASRQVT